MIFYILKLFFGSRSGQKHLHQCNVIHVLLMCYFCVLPWIGAIVIPQILPVRVGSMLLFMMLIRLK